MCIECTRGFCSNRILPFAVSCRIFALIREVLFHLVFVVEVEVGSSVLYYCRFLYFLFQRLHLHHSPNLNFKIN